MSDSTLKQGQKY